MVKVYLSQEFYLTCQKKKPTAQVQYFDRDLPNFFLEYRRTGKMTWYYRYREKNKYRFHRLNTNEMDAVEARRQAYIFRDYLLQKKLSPHALSVSSVNIITFKAFVDTVYIPIMKNRKRSWNMDYAVLKNHVFPYFADTFVHEITALDINNWLKCLHNNGLAASSCNTVFSVVKIVFSLMVQNEYLEIDKNPCKKVQKFKTLPPRERYLSGQEVRKLLTYFNTHSSLKSNYIKLLLFTGARRNEILMAKWCNVDFEQNILTVPLSKSGKTRYIPLSSEAMEVIKNLDSREYSIWLFPGKTGKKHMSYPHAYWKNILRECSIQNFRLHDLRHSYASFMINSGCTLYEVQKVLGHSDPKMTQRYAHLDAKAVLSAVNKTDLVISRE